MGIDDIDYLKKHSVKQSYIFMTDSADRDRRAYPTPSEYVVNFTKPFEKVVGLEVLDASIPRTMYNIDVINNQLAFFIHDDTIDKTTFDTTLCKTVTIPPGEYTIQTLIPALTNALNMHVNDDNTKPLVTIVAESTTNPPDVESKLKFRCPYPFFLDMNPLASTIAEALGFDTHVDRKEAAIPELQRRYDAPVAEDVTLYHSVDIIPSVALGSERILMEGPRGVIRKLPIHGQNYVAQRFIAPANCYFTQFYVALTTENVSLNAGATWELRSGTAESPDMTEDGLKDSGTVAVSFVDGTLSDSSLSAIRYFLQPDTYYWIVLKSDGDDLYAFYNDVLTTETTLRISSDGGDAWSSIDAEGIFYSLSMNIIAKDPYHVLSAPGIYSLVGPRYIVLRCPEIEENSFRSLAYSKHHLGLAKFRLGVVGYSENRLDYSKVPTREFHPIGKLSRLTLRFELSSGQLYDFKGVNHTITFAIHYYEPSAQNMFQQSILNPNYDGNFLSYMYKQEQQESDSDDQEEDFSRDRLADYSYQEMRYHPENQRRRDLEMLYDAETFEDSSWRE